MKTIWNYETAEKYLGNKQERPFANNTRIERHEDGSIMAKYHGNIVADFYPDYTVYSSCGWRTITTKERLNWFLPQGFYIYQTKGVWYLYYRNPEENEYIHWVFADGLVIDKNLVVFNAEDESRIKEVEKLTKKIHIYVDNYITAFLKGKVEVPSSGDCWYCVMKNDEGKPLGELTHNTDHILSHMKDKYYVPSLLVNAIDRYPMCQISMGMFYFFWNDECQESPSDWHKDIFTRDAKASLTRYLKSQLGIAS